MALVSFLARPKPRIPFLGLPCLRHFLRALSLTLVPRSLLVNRMETLATQDRRISKPQNQFLCAQKSTSSRHYKTFLVKMNFLASPFNLSIITALGVTREEILDDGEGEGYRDSIETESETVRQFLSFRSLPFGFSPRHFPQKHLILRLQSFPPAKKAITESRHIYHGSQVRRLQRDCLLGPTWADLHQGGFKNRHSRKYELIWSASGSVENDVGVLN